MFYNSVRTGVRRRGVQCRHFRYNRQRLTPPTSPTTKTTTVYRATDCLFSQFHTSIVLVDDAKGGLPARDAVVVHTNTILALQPAGAPGARCSRCVFAVGISRLCCGPVRGSSFISQFQLLFFLAGTAQVFSMFSVTVNTEPTVIVFRLLYVIGWHTIYNNNN